VLLFQVRLDGAIQRFLAALVVRAEDASRFEDGETVIVFIQNL
jgi:hypothetical protein